MKTEELQGEYFLPDLETRHSGKLIINYDQLSIELILYGRHYIDNTFIDIGKPDDDFNDFHQIVFGTTSHNSITLRNCNWSGTTLIGKDLYEIKYRIEFVFRGVHINRSENIYVKSAEFKFPYLSTWYDGWESLNKIKLYEKGEVAKVELLRTVDNLNLTFIDHYSKSEIKLGNSFKLEYEKYLKFSYEQEVKIDQVLSDAVKFAKLLEFCTNKEVKFKLIWISVQKEMLLNYDNTWIEKDLIGIPIIYFGSYSNKEQIDHFSLHQNYMILSRWVLTKDEVNRTIIQWFSNPTFYHIYDYYLDSNNWFKGTKAVLTNVMFNNRFLNLIQALEAYHDKLDFVHHKNFELFNANKKKVIELLLNDENLINWIADIIRPPRTIPLKGKLNNLILRIDYLIKDIFEHKDIMSQFVEKAVYFRHQLSHGNPDEANQGRPLIWLFHTAQFVLAILILESLKFEPNQILKLVKHNQNYIRKINEIVYGYKVLTR